MESGLNKQGAVSVFDRDMMQRAILLAGQGAGLVAPNPLVGCVIVHDGKIIGEGFHERYGEAHAEVNAIASVDDKTLLSRSSLYVTLEPCAHFGKTPPCADLIIQTGIPRVFIGAQDPFEAVNGRGSAKLRAAGIEVIEHVEEEACREMNRRFFCFQEQNRPYVVLKWAQTTDGFMDIDRGDGQKGVQWISGPETKLLVHQRRAEEAAVMVGRNTVINDNPLLTVREVQGKNPVRVVLSSEADFPFRPALFDNDAPTLVVNQVKQAVEGSCRFIPCADVHDVREVLSLLHRERMLSVLVEGGAKVLESFLTAGLWDEAMVITGPAAWGSGLQAPVANGTLHHEQRCGDDVIRFYRRVS
jgi:diaminohydroxyphosphoribosylaminopyrimidine deaminase/5-amino-6-(5-phosphoribosylamino)uracil reductase